MECSWVDRETELTCGESAEVYWNIPLCPEHTESFRCLVQRRSRSTAVQAAKYHDLDQFPGLCYIVLLPDGNVKIGYSNTEELLQNRLKDLSRDYKAPVVPLATIPGGFVAEAVLHEKFHPLRLPGRGERFRYGPEIAEYLSELR